MYRALTLENNLIMNYTELKFKMFRILNDIEQNELSRFFKLEQVKNCLRNNGEFKTAL